MKNCLTTLPTNMGVFTAEVSKNGYVTGYFNVVAGVGLNTGVVNTTMVLTPVLSDDEYRIVLTWGEEARDLDSHLTYYIEDTKKFHVYYSAKNGFYNGEKIASLDLDDTTSYGPETVTIALKASLVNDGVFKYSVHNYTDRDKTTSSRLSMSDATVRVYIGNTLSKTYTVPKNVVGNVWHVFDIDSTGIKSVNDFYNSSESEVQ